MNRRCTACRYLGGSLAFITAFTQAAPITVMANTSSANFDMRKQVVSLTGILNVTDYTEQVTRGESMLPVTVRTFRFPMSLCLRMSRQRIPMRFISGLPHPRGG